MKVDNDYYLSQEFYNEIMMEANEAEDKQLAEYKRVRQRIYKAIKHVKGNSFLKKLKEDIKANELSSKFELVKKPHGTKQSDYWGYIKGVYVQQYSVGESGDCWWGYIYFPLKENLYLKCHFSD